ncbi:MAG: gas vesicle protein K [Acetobacteraceae bacterium]|nr:gas vesicle protein K [Acetobacteraceae bacterium]
MPIAVETDRLREGVLGLVVALAEIIRDCLKLQAFRRMDSGRLTLEEAERLGQALLDLDRALEDLKDSQGIRQTVAAVRDGLDDLVDDVLDRLVGPPQSAAGAAEV